MAREGLTGSRIRERRVMAGMKQADLARHIGISASYLNLIEHNRRRIGGKLLLNIADTLGVEPQLLTEGADIPLEELPEDLQETLTHQMGRMGLVDRVTLASVAREFSDA